MQFLFVSNPPPRNKHGYKKERIPSRLWGTIETYWHNNRFNNVTEEWGRNKGVFINWWEVDALIVVPPWGRKGRWHKLLMPHLEAWSKEDLEPTDLYGWLSFLPPHGPAPPTS